jgi:hypothetical protein
MNEKYHKRPYVFNQQHAPKNYYKPTEEDYVELRKELILYIKDDRELKAEIDSALEYGSKINAIKLFRNYIEEKHLSRKTTLRAYKEVIDAYLFRLILTKKIQYCRDMIEVYCNANGYGKMKNYKEVKSKKDNRYTWQYSDWEFVDDMYGNMVNDWNWLPAPQVLKDINDIHKKYKLPKYKPINEKGYL